MTLEVEVEVPKAHGGRQLAWALWGLAMLGLALCAMGLAYGYTNYGAAHPGAAPAAGLVARWMPTTIVVASICLGFVLLLTPTGTLPSPRWRWAGSTWPRWRGACAW